MNFLVVRHYFKRAFTDITSLLLLVGLPMGIIIIGSLGEHELVNGYDVGATFMTMWMLLSFQFFTGAVMIYFLYQDFKGDMRWRLNATPHTQRTFFISATIANWIFAVAVGVLIIIISNLFLNVYLGNILILGLVLLLFSLMTALLSLIIFLFIKKVGTANGFIYTISFGILVLGNFMTTSESPVVNFLGNYSNPIPVGLRAIFYSGAMRDAIPFFDSGGMRESVLNIAILLIVVCILAIIAFIGLRRRIDDNF